MSFESPKYRPSPLSLFNINHHRSRMTDMYFQPTQAASTSSLPPLYSPSTASPPYTCQPSEEECRLDYVARLAATRTPEGVFTKHTRRISITLKNQEDGLDAPVYARHGLVSGEIHIDDKNVLAVSVEVGTPNCGHVYIQANGVFIVGGSPDGVDR